MTGIFKKGQDTVPENLDVSVPRAVYKPHSYWNNLQALRDDGDLCCKIMQKETYKGLILQSELSCSLTLISAFIVYGTPF